MTDVIDDSMSWEQRRELRRKKRQELLAEADKLVQNTDSSASSRISQNDESDSFDQERTRRRRDREEKRKKEREEIEKQLKDEEEARAEREKRRDERRRQREEGDTISTKTYKSSTITTTELTTHDDDEDVVEKSVTKVTEYVTNGKDEYANQNGDEEIENGEIEYKEKEEEKAEEEEEDDEAEELNEEDDTTKTTSTYTASITITSNKKVERRESSSSSESDVEEQREVEREEAQQEEEEESESDHEVVEEKPAPKTRSEILAERRKQREQERLEEEEREKAEAERLKEEREAKLKEEREGREKRMAEGEAKRKELKKQISKDVEPLTAKGNTSSPLIMKNDVTDDSAHEISSGVKSKSKIQRETGKKNTVDDNMSYAMKSQSFHVRSSTETPSRPLGRKNQTRRSLNALEKQAGDLYSFLSELEVQKSAGPEKLKVFLETSERSEKCGPEMKSLLESKNKPRASVRDRMKQLGIDSKENSSQQYQTTSPAKQSIEIVNNNIKTSPKPPARSDSMKRLAVARTKYVNKSPDNSSKNDVKSLENVPSSRKSPVESLSKVEEEHIDDNHDSYNEKVITEEHIVIKFDLHDEDNSQDDNQCSKTSENPSKPEKEIAIQSYSENANAERDSKKPVEVVNNVDIEKPSNISNEEASKNEPVKDSEPKNVKTGSDRVRSRRHDKKPELPPKPESISPTKTISRSKSPDDDKSTNEIEEETTVITEKYESDSFTISKSTNKDATLSKPVSKETRSRRSRNAAKSKITEYDPVTNTELEEDKKEPAVGVSRTKLLAKFWAEQCF